MKTIIVATDYSDNASNALQYAGALAACTQAKIILFNAFQLPVHASNTLLPADSIEDLMQSNIEHLQRKAREVAAQFKIPVTYTSEYAYVEDALEKLVSEVQADLVIIGMHDNDWSDRLLGNTTTAIIHAATYPVLIVPASARFKGMKKILYAFDSHCLYRQHQLDLLKDIADSLKSEVQVFHVSTPDAQHRYNPTTSMLSSSKVEVALSGVTHTYKDVEGEDVIGGIENGIEELGADLIAMSPRKLGFWSSLLYRSTTRTMALRTHLPLLVLPDTAIKN